jgi:hypothetical protein
MKASELITLLQRAMNYKGGDIEVLVDIPEHLMPQRIERIWIAEIEGGEYFLIKVNG